MPIETVKYKKGNVYYYSDPVGPGYPEPVKNLKKSVSTLTVLKRMESAGIRTIAKGIMSEFEYECFLASNYIYSNDAQVIDVITRAGGNPDEILKPEFEK